MGFHERVKAIETMEVRGAGRIGREGAFALSEWVESFPGGSDFPRYLEEGVRRILSTRPSAVSLPNAVHFVQSRVLQGWKEEGYEGALREARKAAAEFERRSLEALREIGRIGSDLVEEGSTYLTHCNSQAVLSLFREARRQGREFRVLATETRPWRQGILTVRELHKEGISTSLLVDSAVGAVVESVDGVFVGADAVALNGDVVNKIGTRLVALAAREAGVPLRVAAETYKVDSSASTGKEVRIEERASEEVVQDGEIPSGVHVLNPVFDVTPSSWVLEVVSEMGILPPHEFATKGSARWKAGGLEGDSLLGGRA